MIELTFNEDEIAFTCSKTNKHSAIKKAEYPEAFAHPRQLIADFAMAEEALRKEMKKYSRWLIAPKVSVRIKQDVQGGMTPVDIRTIKDVVIRAGARDVTLL